MNGSALEFIYSTTDTCISTLQHESCTTKFFQCKPSSSSLLRSVDPSCRLGVRSLCFIGCGGCGNPCPSTTDNPLRDLKSCWSSVCGKAEAASTSRDSTWLRFGTDKRF